MIMSESFPFDLLKPKECGALVRDILSLYEACIFDMSGEIKAIACPDKDIFEIAGVVMLLTSPLCGWGVGNDGRYKL